MPMAINLLVMMASTKQKNDFSNVSTGLVWMPTSLIILKLATYVKFDMNDDHPPPALLSTLPQPTEPNQRVHADLFGPLKTRDSGKKFILCITDALTKYVELVPLPNKEADTVVNAIFDKWYCRFGTPFDIVTDQGKEFCASISNKLFKRLGTNQFLTTLHHPQYNSQAEVAN